MDDVNKAIRADRIAEERSENEGMPEHRAKASDPARWARTRPQRVARVRHPVASGMLGLVLAAEIAVLTVVALLAPRRV